MLLMEIKCYYLKLWRNINCELKDKVSQPIISTIDINKTQSGTSLPLLSVISVKHLFLLL